jgi:hypothetical protein
VSLSPKNENPNGSSRQQQKGKGCPPKSTERDVVRAGQAYEVQNSGQNEAASEEVKHKDFFLEYLKEPEENDPKRYILGEIAVNPNGPLERMIAAVTDAHTLGSSKIYHPARERQVHQSKKGSVKGGDRHVGS